MKYFEKNLKTITGKNQTLGIILSQGGITPEDHTPLDIKKTPSGVPTALLRGKYIHSGRDPVREANRIIAQKNIGENSICILEGFGLGYYAESALKAGAAAVIIVEESIERFKESLSARDMTDFLSNPNIYFLVGEKESGISILLASLPSGRIQTIRNRTLYINNTHFYDSVEKYIQQYISRKMVNETTLKRFGRIWIRNLIHNMTLLPETENIAALDTFFGTKPVLLLAAGPSFNALQPYLKVLREKFIIVAVDTVSRALVRENIKPDFLVVIDPQYWNARHLDRINFNTTILVSESSTYPSVFRNKFYLKFFSGSLFPLGQFIEKFSGPRKRLGAGGSVSTSAWDFAHILTTGEVFCAGLDLGFPFLETHYKGSFFEERAHILSNRLLPSETSAFNALYNAKPFYHENNGGTQTLTDNRLIVYKQWFEEKIEQQPFRKTYSISKEAIKIRGIDYIPLEKLLTYPDIRSSIDEKLTTFEPVTNIEKIAIRSNIKKGVEILVQELEKLSSFTQNGIKLIDTFLKANTEISLEETLSKLDECDSKIMAMSSKNLSGFLIQPVLRDISEQKSPKTPSIRLFQSQNSGKTPLPFETSRKLYSEIGKASEYHLNLLKFYLKNHKE